MYTKGHSPQNINEIPRYVSDEYSKLEDESKAPEVESIRFTVHYVEPDKPRVAELYYADGTQWNPSGGEGLYLRTSSGWVKQ